jgi:hypothetical protein
LLLRITHQSSKKWYPCGGTGRIGGIADMVPSEMEIRHVKYTELRKTRQEEPPEESRRHATAAELPDFK